MSTFTTSPGGPSATQTITRMLGRIASTGTHRALEMAPIPHRSRSVPASVADLTAEWLTQALCARAPGTRVTGFQAEGATSQTTSRATLSLDYDGPGAAWLPQSVFAKFTTTFQQRLFMGLIRCIDGEPLYYRNVRGLLDIEGPEGYFGAVDLKSWRSVVLIEDVARTQGASFLHATSNVSRTDIESLLLDMARYHGNLWSHPALATHRWLKRPIDHFHNTSVFLNMRKRVAVGVERAGDVVPEAVRTRLDDLWTHLLYSMSSNSSGPLTLLHGDPHVGNTYRAGNGTMALLDWQVCMKGSWAFDFAYAVGSALAVEDRRAWESDLLQMYLDALGAAGGAPPSLAVAMDQYRHSLMYPFHTWTTVIGRSALQPRMQEDDVSKLIIERLSHAIADHEAFGSRV